MTDDTPTLIADIGGTNARFALCDRAGRYGDAQVLPCADHPGFAAAAAAYLEMVRPSRRPRRAVIDVASAVAGDLVALTNRNWTFSIEEARRALGLDTLAVINDFTAVALAVPRLTPADVTPVGGGTAVGGAPMAVIGPGTGLGVAGLIPADGRWRPLPCEGGHVTLTTVEPREAEIAAALRRRHGHASAERALSGPGLAGLWRAIAEVDGAAGEDPPPPPEITARARSGACPRSAEALAVFFRLLGTTASNLALTLDARGGVFMAGGILPRLLPELAASDFRARFEDKGRFTAYLREIPTVVVTHPLPAFVGLAHLVAGEDR